MPDEARAVTWEAPEHRHIEKTTDWYWALGIVAIAGALASIMFNNILFGVVILLGAATMVLVARRHPKMLAYEVSARGIRIGEELHPFTSLEAYAIHEDLPEGPQLIVKSKHMFTQLLILPLPEEYVDDIESILSIRISEEPLVEPLSHRLLELFGF